MIDVERHEVGPADWLLHSVDERQQDGRVEHPVAALHRPLQDVVDLVHGLARHQVLRLRVE